MPTEYGISGVIRAAFFEEAAKPLSILNVHFTVRLANELRQLGDIRRDPPRFIFGKHFGAGRRNSQKLSGEIALVSVHFRL